MGYTCELVGEIEDSTATVDRVVGDKDLGEETETFYSVKVKLKTCEIPILVSEYNLDQIIKGKVRITGSLFSDYVSNQIPRFYVYANKLEAADPDEELTNEVSYMGTVTKIKPLSHDSYGRDVLFMYVSTVSPLNSESLLFLVLKNQLARVNKDRKPHFKVRGTGYIKKYRDVYEIIATKFEVLPSSN